MIQILGGHMHEISIYGHVPAYKFCFIFMKVGLHF